MIDVEGFLSLNVVLNNIFKDKGEMEEDDNVDDLEEDEDECFEDDDKDDVLTMEMWGNDVPPSVIFAQLANSNDLVTKN